MCELLTNIKVVIRTKSSVISNNRTLFHRVTGMRKMYLISRIHNPTHTRRRSTALIVSKQAVQPKTSGMRSSKILLCILSSLPSGAIGIGMSDFTSLFHRNDEGEDGHSKCLQHDGFGRCDDYDSIWDVVQNHKFDNELLDDDEEDVYGE